MRLMTANVEPIAVLDLGSQQTRVIIAEEDAQDQIRILGHGECRTRGVAKGVINNAELAQQSIADALAQAEALANINLKHLAVSINTTNLTSTRLSLSEHLNGEQVTPEVRQTLANAARKEAQTRLPQNIQWYNLHMIPLGFSLDGDQTTDSPDGLSCQTLVAHYHLVHVPKMLVENLKACLWKNNIDLETMVLAPYAAGMSALKPNLREFGATLVDLGAETTSITTFQGWKLQRAATLAIGGNHISHDVARAFSISSEHAERLKITQANLTVNFGTSAPDAGAPLFDGHEADRTDTSPIVKKRLDEILDAVSEILTDPRFSLQQTRSLVFTGAGAGLRGFATYAERKFYDRWVQVMAPLGLNKAPEELTSTSFATAVGLVRYMTKWRAQRSTRRGNFVRRGLNAQSLPLLGRFFAT